MHAPAGTAQVSVSLAAEDPGTSLHLNYNDARIEPIRDGSYPLDVLAGRSFLVVRTLAARGIAGQTYRWVIIVHP